MEKTRKYWVDSAKGLGILLIIIGHLLYESKLFNSDINKIIYSFHVPMFFIISGYLSNEIKSKYIVKKFKKLIIPYIIYIIIGIPLFGFLLYKNGNDLLKIIRNFLYLDGIVENNPLWFLIVLFEVYLINFLLDFPSRKISVQLIIVILSTIAGYFIYKMNLNYLNYFGINRAIICFAFFSFGNILRKIPFKFNCMVLFVITACMNIFLSVRLNTKVSLYGFVLGNYIFFYLAAISGSIAIMVFCKMKLDKVNFFTNISKYAILFLGTQYFWIIPVKILIVKFKLENIYDLIMIPLAIIYILLIPKSYEMLKNRFKIIKYLNGEQ